MDISPLLHIKLVFFPFCIQFYCLQHDDLLCCARAFQLSKVPIIYCWSSCPFCKLFRMSFPWQGDWPYSPLTLLSGSLWLNLCWNLWYILSLVLYIKGISIDLLRFFYMHPCNLASTVCWRYCLLSSVYFLLICCYG